MFDKLKQAYMPKTNFPTRTIDYDKCSQCRRCYESCPVNGFEWGKDDYPKPIGFGGLEQACVGCWNCVSVCPKNAVSLEGAYSVLAGRYKTLLPNDMRMPNPLSTNGKKTFKDIESDLTEIERVIYKRRSNRLFKDKEIPEALIKRILEAGRFAPSAGNCQPYKFIVVTNKEIIKEFERISMKTLKLLRNLYLDKKGKKRLWKTLFMSPYSWMKINNMDQRPMAAIEKADREDDGIYWNAPAVILICKDVRGISNPDLDAGICAQNMVLAAHSLKLGTCYISLPMKPLSYPTMAKFRKRLGVKYPWTVVTSIALGYPKGKIDGIVKRDTPLVEWI